MSRTFTVPAHQIDAHEKFHEGETHCVDELATDDEYYHLGFYAIPKSYAKKIRR
jgi:hypothetical protein